MTELIIIFQTIPTSQMFVNTSENDSYKEKYTELWNNIMTLREELSQLKMANWQLREELRTTESDHSTELERERRINADLAHQIMMLGGTQPVGSSL